MEFDAINIVPASLIVALSQRKFELAYHVRDLGAQVCKKASWDANCEATLHEWVRMLKKQGFQAVDFEQTQPELLGRHAAHFHTLRKLFRLIRCRRYSMGSPRHWYPGSEATRTWSMLCGFRLALTKVTIIFSPLCNIDLTPISAILNRRELLVGRRPIWALFSHIIGAMRLRPRGAKAMTYSLKQILGVVLLDWPL